MLRIYIGEIIKNKSYLPALYPLLGDQIKERTLFQKRAFKFLNKPFFELVKKPEEADYFLLPHDYFYLRRGHDSYLRRYAELSKKHKKPLIVFFYGDLDEEIKISNSIIFRTSQYKSKKRSNEIIMPAYVEDLAPDGKIVLRGKSARPIVGFCGWAGFKSARERFKYYLKNAIVDAKKILFFDPMIEVRKKGLYFRKNALRAFDKSPLVKTNFVLRRSFSGHKDTAEINPEKARADFIDNMINSDFALCVKGDGNYSDRFYEALSLGRVPVFVDTDCVLPLEDKINYRDFALFIDWRNVNNIDKLTAGFYGNLSDEDFQEMQKKARAAFERLRIDRFLAEEFKNLEAIMRS